MAQATEKKTADQAFAEMVVSKLEAGTTPWQRGWSINEALCKPFHNCVSGVSRGEHLPPFLCK